MAVMCSVSDRPERANSDYFTIDRTLASHAQGARIETSA